VAADFVVLTVTYGFIINRNPRFCKK